MWKKIKMNGFNLGIEAKKYKENLLAVKSKYILIYVITAKRKYTKF